MTSVILLKLLLFFALALPGYLLGRFGLINSAALPSFTNVLLCVAMPATVFTALADMNGIGLSGLDAVAILLLSFFSILLFCFLGVYFLFRHSSQNEKRVCTFCSIFSNCGFLGIPLVSYLFPQRREILVLVSLYNVVSSFLLWTLGISLLSGNKDNVSLRKALRNPLSLALLAGVLFSFLPHGTFKSQVLDFTSMLSSVTAPLSMLLLGFQLRSVSLRSFFRQRSLLLVILTKLLLFPVFTVTVLLLIHVVITPVSSSLLLSVFFASGVSTAATAPALSEEFAHNGQCAAKLTVATTLGCIVSLPLLYFVFTKIYQYLGGVL